MVIGAVLYKEDSALILLVRDQDELRMYEACSSDVAGT